MQDSLPEGLPEVPSELVEYARDKTRANELRQGKNK